MQHFDEILRLARATGRDDGNAGRIADGSCQRAIKSALDAVAIHRGEQDFARTEMFATMGPLHRVDSCRVAPSPREYVPFARADAARVDREHNGLRTELVIQLADEL